MIDEGNFDEYLLNKLERLRVTKASEEINITFIKTSSDEHVNTFCDNFFNLLNDNTSKTIGVRVRYILTI
jgi:hypothetical protein